MDWNILLVIFLVLPFCVSAKPMPKEKGPLVTDLKRLLPFPRRDSVHGEDNRQTKDLDAEKKVQLLRSFDSHEEYILPDDTYWGGDEWIMYEEDGQGHGHDIIDNLALGLEEFPIDLFASFEVFDEDEFYRPFIDFKHLPAQVAQNKDHHRNNKPQFARRNFGLTEIITLWNRTIPYYIDREKIRDQENVESIEKGIKDINQLTCLTIIKEEHVASPTSVLRFTDDDGGCWSYVGYIGDSIQDIGLSPGCFDKSTVLHEIMHAIGMEHEHQRSDRDKYIKMLWGNIEQGKENRNMMLEKTRDINPFDLESVLQYGLYAFSNNGKRTMRPLDDNLEFLPNSANGLTFYDVMDITSGYQCTKDCKTKPNCIHGGFVGHKCKCMCPSGTRGATCQEVDSDCGKIISLKSGESEIITSPNYPNTYGVDKDCVWIIKTLDSSKIHLTFEELKLPRNEETKRCYHWLEVRYNLIGQTGPKRCGSITSTSSKASIVSNGHLMMLKLNSRFAKDISPGKGFKLKVTAVYQEAGQPCNSSPCKNGGTCANKFNSFICICALGWKGSTCTVSLSQLICTFESDSCFLTNDYKVKQASQTAQIQTAASGSKFIMADKTDPFIVLSIDETKTKLVRDQQYCLSYKYIIGGTEGEVEIGFGYDELPHSSLTTGWTTASHTFTAVSDGYLELYLSVFSEFGETSSYGAIDDVTLSSGSC